MTVLDNDLANVCFFKRIAPDIPVVTSSRDAAPGQ
jgi:hypothetical protein